MSDRTILKPQDEAGVVDAVQEALAGSTPLEIIGHGSKRGIGHRVDAGHVLDVSELKGVTLYEPDELVLSAKAGTPMAVIEKLLSDNDQCFHFEPMDYGPLLSGESGRGTIGGALAANLSGPAAVLRQVLRAIMCSVCVWCPDAANCSNPADGWSRT